ncbi:hypothetical protein DVH05_004627 [Phytophthora capsici]|nr:hypothetical protein DVH05_004627 [Phytophthora capsici]
MYVIMASYTSSCEGTPNVVYSFKEPNCEENYDNVCQTMDFGGPYRINCSTDYMSTMRSMFGNSPYILQELYDDSSCSSLNSSYGYLATGNCEGSRDITEDEIYTTATLGSGGDASVYYYTDNLCQDENEIEGTSEHASSSTLLYHSCQENYNNDKYYKWYSSKDSRSSSSSGSGDDDNSGLSTGAIIGMICGGVVVVLIIVGLIIICRRRSQGKARNTNTRTARDTMSIEVAMRGQTGLWTDDVITAKRIPRDKVKVKNLLSRGAFGEVYKGIYNGQAVAVKMLPPSTRGNIQHVNDFLAEAKLTATMDHPHIVTFIGVAWDSLSDVCVVLEFMDGGDLRTLLNSYETTKRPVGFNKQKATIALHVCEALTYLHSLMPPVIHRDLKSRNILLNRNLEAKLTDFGISKERLDQTMTAGVGTCLWMAPEVMMGEKYDVKADIFSLGVMLSELDVHTLPYAQAKERNLTSTGRKMADATLLQKIASGEVQVEFSEMNPRPLLELGLACVAVDPFNRPTASEAQYRLQMIIRQELE